jgi:hypothetical protein
LGDIPLLVLGSIIFGGMLFVACYYISLKILKQIFIREKGVNKKKKSNTLIGFDNFERPDSRTKIIAYSASGIFALIGIAIFLLTPDDLRSPISCLIVVAGLIIGLIFSIDYFEKSEAAAKKSEWVEQKPVIEPTYQWKEPIISENLKLELITLADKPAWNWDRFRSILICQGRIGEGCYIPAAQRPDYIYLDGFLPTINELRQISSQRNGRESSRVGLVDRERQKLVISGKTVVGTDSQVHLNMGSQPGREAFQLPILTIHFHPDKGGERGLSNQDYISFLTDRRQVMMMICFRGGVMFTMKTSSTRKIISSESATKWVSGVLKEMMIQKSQLNLPGALLAFNKEICLEFGLTLYQALVPSENVARRIEVV